MVAILFEGKSDEKILNQICEAYNLPKEQIKYLNFKGKDNIFNLNHQYYNRIEDELDIIDKIFIAVDADDPKDSCPTRGYTQTEEKLQELISDLNFDLMIDYFIFSDESKQKGYLESFLLSVLDEQQQKCINNFQNCYRYELSDKWVFNTFYKQKSHPFDYEHPNFNELKTKLKNLFEGMI